jgi:CPA2 family monovalent cation:H+ antiporter-2
MEHHGGLIEGLVIILLVTVILVPLLNKARLSSVIGYLTVGAIIGPNGAGLIPLSGEIDVLAELGVVFLLFTLGLELSIDRLKTMRRDIFGMGMAQVVLTGAVITGIALAFGQSGPTAMALGAALALSSTAVVMQLLGEQGQLASRLGRAAFAILLFQDIAVAPILASLPLLEGDPSAIWAALGWAALNALGMLVLILVAARLLLRPILALAASSGTHEVFIATALLLAVGTGWATNAAGLSMALGAFLAGTAIAGTEYRPQVEADIQPFSGILLGFFFVTVGMRLDLLFLAAEWLVILGLLVGLLAVKASLIVGLARLFGHGWPTAVRLGLLLAQGGEFAFVILSLALSQGTVESATAQLIIAVVTLSMVLTPFMAAAGGHVEQWMERRGLPVPRGAADIGELRDHVIIAGFGRVGKTVAHLLKAYDVPHVALDMRTDHIRANRKEGWPVFFGDAANAEVLDQVGAKHACALVITLDDPHAAAAVVRTAKERFGQLSITARAHDIEHADKLRSTGAAAAVPETMESSLQLGAAALEGLGLPREEVNWTVDQIRQRGYRLDIDRSARPDGKAPG